MDDPELLDRLIRTSAQTGARVTGEGGAKCKVKCEGKDEGKGEGVLAVGVEFRYDEENDTLTMARVGSQPIRLNQITMRIEGGG